MQGVTWVTFPKPVSNKEKCHRWIRACGRADHDFNATKINKDVYICSKHFVGGVGPTKEHPDPIPANACKAQVCVGVGVGEKSHLDILVSKC